MECKYRLLVLDLLATMGLIGAKNYFDPRVHRNLNTALSVVNALMAVLSDCAIVAANSAFCEVLV